MSSLPVSMGARLNTHTHRACLTHKQTSVHTYTLTLKHAWMLKRTPRHMQERRVGVEMRAPLCRLLLYLPSAALYLKLQLQNLCNFSQTPPFKAFHWEYLHVNIPFSSPCFAFSFTCLSLFELSVQLQRLRSFIFSIVLHYVLLIARCEKEERQGFFFFCLRGRSSYRCQW